ncbi:MAG: NfeD family protein [Microthrixaceae bacterium]
MHLLFWICAIGGVVLLVIGIVTDGLADGVFDALSFGDDGAIVPVTGAFLASFGIVGLVAESLTDGNRLVAIGAAAVGGLLFAALAARFVSSALGMHTDPTPTSSDLLGRGGRVVTPIDVDAAGEVLVRLSGQRLKLLARAESPVAVGTDVVVVEVLSPSAVRVEPEASFFGGSEGGTHP